MDPASGLDAPRYIGIRGGKIAAISESPLQGTTIIDAAGLVVAPGFIDLHSHGQTPENYRFKARDGVTTALELEVGVSPVTGWYAAREGKALINFGATSGHIPARMAVMHDPARCCRTIPPKARLLPSNSARSATWWRGDSTKAHSASAWGSLSAAGHAGRDPGSVSAGCAAKGHDLRPHAERRPGGTRGCGCAAGGDRRCGRHRRFAARRTHYQHGIAGDGSLSRHDSRRATTGIDITTEMYPYTAGMTDLGSAVFDEGWEAKQGGIGFHDFNGRSPGNG